MLKSLWLHTRERLRRLKDGATDLVDRRRGRPRPEVSRRSLERIIGRQVGDLSLYARAMRHRSVLRGQKETHLLSNERLEFLGDALVGMVVAEKLYEDFPDRDEGFLTRTRSKLVSGPALAEFASALGLGRMVLLAPNMAAAEGRDNPTILADAFEALVGAIYLDLGFDAARTFVLDVLDQHVDLTAVSERRSNFKSMLLEAVQAEGRGQPLYEVVEEEGPSHERVFTIEVVVEGTPMGRGRARSKKQAEQVAARQALEKMRSPSSRP